MDCVLCQELPLENLILDADKYVVILCPRCKMPILIWTGHGKKMTKEDLQEVKTGLSRAGDATYGNEMYDHEFTTCVMGDHYHAHVRPRQIPMDMGDVREEPEDRAARRGEYF